MNQGMRTQKETKSLKRISITKRSNLNRPKKSWKRFRRRNKRPDHLQIFSTTMTTYKNQLKKNKKRKSIRNESRKRLLVKKSQALLPQRVSPKSLKMWLLRSKRRNQRGKRRNLLKIKPITQLSSLCLNLTGICTMKIRSRRRVLEISLMMVQIQKILMSLLSTKHPKSQN